MKLSNTPELRAHRRRIKAASRFNITFYQVQKSLVRLQDGMIRHTGIELLSRPITGRYQAKKCLRMIRRTHPTAKIVSHTCMFHADEIEARNEFKRSIK